MYMYMYINRERSATGLGDSRPISVLRFWISEALTQT